MGMQTMQAQQPMQGGGKGSMMQPQQTSNVNSGGNDVGIGDLMRNQFQPAVRSDTNMERPMPTDMGMGYGRQQPRYGQPNRYSNTTQQPWDNANINQQPGGKGGGGKGGNMQQGNQMQSGGGKGQSAYPTAQTNFGQSQPMTQPLTTPASRNQSTPNQDSYGGVYDSGGQGGM